MKNRAKISSVNCKCENCRLSLYSVCIRFKSKSDNYFQTFFQSVFFKLAWKSEFYCRSTRRNQARQKIMKSMKFYFSICLHIPPLTRRLVIKYNGLEGMQNPKNVCQTTISIFSRSFPLSRGRNCVRSTILKPLLHFQPRLQLYRSSLQHLPHLIDLARGEW